MSTITPKFNKAHQKATEKLLQDMGLKFTKQPDGMFVVESDIDLENKNLTALPDFSAVIVQGFFWCDKNQLTSLKGAPASVRTIFSCRNNQLTTLEGAPASIGISLWCSGNNLTSLEGLPREFKRVRSDFGSFNFGEVPEELLTSPETKARIAKEKQDALEKEMKRACSPALHRPIN